MLSARTRSMLDKDRWCTAVLAEGTPSAGVSVCLAYVLLLTCCGAQRSMETWSKYSGCCRTHQCSHRLPLRTVELKLWWTSSDAQFCTMLQQAVRCCRMY